MRKPRKGELICTCGAYRFPHRFGGGRCTGFYIVEQYWENHYGSGDCTHCNSCNRTEAVPYCEVVTGGESVRECPVWQEFTRFNEVKLRSNRREEKRWQMRLT